MSAGWVTVVVLATLAALGYGLAVAGAERSRLRRRLESASAELEHLQTSFARFAPQEVVERIIASGVATTAEKREITILFADLVGFTRLSETLDPDTLVGVLNRYFVRMSAAVSEHRGHVSKFIGDGMLVLFGALEPNPWQINDAVHAALAMRADLDEYNRELARDGLGPLRVGIGVHHGVVVAGVVGSHELMEFTVIGNEVNVAARVERLTRTHGEDVLVTRQVKERLDPRFVLRELPATAIRGLTEPVVTYAVDGITS